MNIYLNIFSTLMLNMITREITLTLLQYTKVALVRG